MPAFGLVPRPGLFGLMVPSGSRIAALAGLYRAG